MTQQSLTRWWLLAVCLSLVGAISIGGAGTAVAQQFDGWHQALADRNQESWAAELPSEASAVLLP